MRLQITFLLPLALLTLGGCAATPYKAKLFETGTNCVDDLHALSRTPLRFLGPDDKAGGQYVEFASLAQCYRTTGIGTTPVALYQLDGVMPSAEVTVSVTLSTGGTFAAAVEVLDADFQSLRRYGFEEFVRRGSEYSLNVFLNQSGKPPAYLMLLPDRSQAGKSDVAVGSARNPILIPAGPVMFVYNAGNETNSIRPFLEGGRVNVVAKPQGSAAFSHR